MNFMVPPPGEPQTETGQAVRLLWHLCQLCNVSTSQLGAYLSLEALQRDTIQLGLLVPMQHHPMLAAQAALLVDNSTNIEAAMEMLAQTGSHQQWINDPAYRSLLEAARGFPAIMEAVKRGMTWKSDIDMLRKAYDAMTDLCHGNAQSNIKGWRECWNEVVLPMMNTGAQ